ncbi:response regulator [Mesonia sp. MT50]|uniref:Response regulator n=1 Tax=Mesonia profundi TaxID=3070998 RepID=A0ABU0ZXV2_9FLAO|nr:response regulator [Mesonia profundi]MDQ7916290.1 response regulator [Mesonia profundi]
MKICIIDDDKIYQFLLKKIIHIVNKEVTVHSFHNGEEAMEFFKQKDSSFDMIFLDLNMPKMDGWEFIERYQELITNNSTSPEIYVSTSSISESDQLKVASCDLVKAYLTKPITIEAMEKIIK